MMTFAAPFVLGLAAAAALVVTGLHLLSVRRPPALLLPTARFVPTSEVRAVSRTRTPSDLLLLLLRVAALLAAGFALAGPRFHTAHDGRVAIVAIEPGVVRDTAAVRRLLVTDSLVADARLVFVTEALSAPTAASAASYDAAQIFPRAIQIASRLVHADPSIDSLALIVLRATPATEDRAWRAWRAAWPGSVVTYAPQADSLSAATQRVSTQRVARRVVIVPQTGVGDPSTQAVPSDDVVEASFRWHAARVNTSDRSASDSVIVDSIFVSRLPSHADALRTVARSGQVHVFWPLSGAPHSAAVKSPTSESWSGWQTASAGDTAVALVAGETAMMGTWSVTQFGMWRPETEAGTLAGADSLRVAQRVQPLAWWSDGRVAAIEQYVNTTCERAVAVLAAQGQDVLLAPSANAFFDRLLAPCLRPALVSIDALDARTVLGAALAPASALRTPDRDRTSDDATGDRWVRWIPSVLLAFSLVALLLEWRMRRAASAVPT